MSLVQAIIYKHFVLVCSDQQANLSNGLIKNDFRKIFKISENIIIGMTGSIEDNYELFQDFFNKDFTIKPYNKNLKHAYDLVEKRYNEIFEKHQDKGFEKKYNIFSLVCGWNGYQFEGKSFFLDKKPSKQMGITRVIPENVDNVKIINCGKDIHLENFKKIALTYPFSLETMKFTFLKVLKEGVNIDNTINEKFLFEEIVR